VGKAFNAKCLEPMSKDKRINVYRSAVSNLRAACGPVEGFVVVYAQY